MKNISECSLFSRTENVRNYCDITQDDSKFYNVVAKHTLQTREAAIRQTNGKKVTTTTTENVELICDQVRSESTMVQQRAVDDERRVRGDTRSDRRVVCQDWQWLLSVRCGGESVVRTAIARNVFYETV